MLQIRHLTVVRVAASSMWDPHLAVNLDEIKLPKKYNFNISFVNPDTYDVVYEPVRVIITDKNATITSEMEKIFNCPNAEIQYESIEYDLGSGDTVMIDKYHKILTIPGTQIIDIAIYYSREIIKYLYIKLEEQRWIQKHYQSINTLNAPQSCSSNKRKREFFDPCRSIFKKPKLNRLVFIKLPNESTIPLYTYRVPRMRDLVYQLGRIGYKFDLNDTRFIARNRDLKPFEKLDEYVNSVTLLLKLRGGAQEEYLSSECSVADQHDRFRVISYNGRGSRSGQLEGEIHRLIDANNPHIIHITEYRAPKDIKLPNYSLLKFHGELECDRQAVYILRPIEDVCIVNNHTKFIHTIKIHNHAFSFTYIPPRYKNRLDPIVDEMRIGFNNKSLFIGDVNMVIQSLENSHDRSGRYFAALMAENSYVCKNTPFESTMKQGSRINDQVWCHQLDIALTSEVFILRNIFTASDHFPILIEKVLDAPLSIMGNIRWNLLKSDNHKKDQWKLQIKSKFEKLNNNIQNHSIDEIWEHFTRICEKTAAKELGTIKITDSRYENEFDRQQDSLQRRKDKMKRKLNKRNISNGKRARLKLQIKVITNKMRKNKGESDRNSFQEYLQNSTGNASKAFIEMWRLRRSANRNTIMTKCDLADAIQFQRNHFSSNERNWPTHATAITPATLNIANSIFNLDAVTSTFKHTNSTKISGDTLPSLPYKHLPDIGYTILHHLIIRCYLE
eukprot:NODE_589_length_5652_cov_0.848730.p1 type:complete len:729 gc:universal NODE_589_length_5652_cov_0.848730:4858-2672(-)